MSSPSASIDDPKASSFKRPILPPELLIEIFRDSAFSSSDLAKLSLVSKSFLSSIRTSLCQRIVINHAGNRDSPARDVGIVRGSLELVKLLEKDREIAELVEEVEFRWKCSSECQWVEQDSPSREETVEKVLQAAVNLKKLTIKFAFLQMGSVYNVLSRFDMSKINHLEVFCLIHQDGERITQFFPSVRSITIYSTFGDDQFPASPRANYPQLEHFANFTTMVGSFPHPFYASSQLTLKTLELSYHAIRNFIDFVKFPQLKTLHVVDMVEIPTPPHYDEHESMTPFLFRKLCLSKSIETLILKGPDKLPRQQQRQDLSMDHDYDDDEPLPYHFFDTPDVSSLKRIELRGKIREDRVFRLFGVNPMSGLKQLVVPWMMETGDKAEEEKREMEKVAKLCERRRVELLYAARPPYPPLYYHGVPIHER
ncbi:hypothetical protein JCM3765_004327 [Sporobolomyces pararoseus]